MTTLAVKVLEIRDRATFIPAIAIKVSPSASVPPTASRYWHMAERYLLARAGYGDDGAVILLRADAHGRVAADPYEWGDRTMQTAHLYIDDMWAFIDSGDVVDVEWIAGETLEPKLSERVPELAADEAPRHTHRTVKIRVRPTRVTICAPSAPLGRHPFYNCSVYAVRNVPMAVTNAAVLNVFAPRALTYQTFEVDYVDLAGAASTVSPAAGEPS